jgi:hypothetical protein
MLYHGIRIMDVWQCIFITICILMKAVIKDRNMYHEIIAACIIYLIQQNVMALINNTTMPI